MTHTTASRPLRATRLLALAAALAAAPLAGLAGTKASLPMLHASGRAIVDTSGKTVPLRGVNLGGWFIMEKWMSPLDSSNSIADTYGAIQELDARFGVAKEQSLIKTYQTNWITTTDLDDLQSAGFNVVRVPVWWGQFYPINNISNGSWRADAFERLDWLVSKCAARGLYVIIDMHGVVGGQSLSDDTGRANQNTYWNDANAQANTTFMWKQIATHYKGNSTVAAYDLINEPVGTPTNDAAVNAQDNLYKAVRSVDPDHMIMIEGTFGSWNWSMLPPPSQKGWTNVVYEMHEYQYSNSSSAGVEAGTDRQVADFNNHASWNVPGIIGEFNDFGNGSATWQYTTNAYNKAGLSWTMWSYKATHGLVPDSWGYYDPTFWPTTPDLTKDSSTTIASDWKQWATSKSFALNTSLGIDGGGVNGGGGISTSTWYNVVNQGSAACADATGWGTANGTLLQQWACGNQAANQEWQFQSVGTGVYKIANRNAPAEIMDASGSASGSAVQLWAYGGGANQQWTATALSNGNWKIVGKASGLCLGVAGASKANGAALQIQTCDGSAAQSWQLSAQP